MSEDVTHPDHYAFFPAKCPSCGTTIEPRRVARHLSFNLGNAVKYACRAGRKGVAIDDLEKAIDYLRDEIDMLRDSEPEEGE